MANSSSRKPESPTEELVLLAVVLLRHLSESQSVLARELHGVGFGATRIAELLGTTPNTVNQAIQKGKKAKSRSNRARPKGE